MHRLLFLHVSANTKALERQSSRSSAFVFHFSTKKTDYIWNVICQKLITQSFYYSAAFVSLRPYFLLKRSTRPSACVNF